MTNELTEVEQQLNDFEKEHTETFLYFLQEYEKWQRLKRKQEDMAECLQEEKP